jgi:hypothetical protein
MLSELPEFLRYVWGIAFCALFFWTFRSSMASVFGNDHARKNAPYLVIGVVVAFLAAIAATQGGHVVFSIAILIWLALVAFFVVALVLSALGVIKRPPMN